MGVWDGSGGSRDDSGGFRRGDRFAIPKSEDFECSGGRIPKTGSGSNPKLHRIGSSDSCVDSVQSRLATSKYCSRLAGGGGGKFLRSDPPPLAPQVWIQVEQ